MEAGETRGEAWSGGRRSPCARSRERGPVAHLREPRSRGSEGPVLLGDRPTRRRLHLASPMRLAGAPTTERGQDETGQPSRSRAPCHPGSPRRCEIMFAKITHVATGLNSKQTASGSPSPPARARLLPTADDLTNREHDSPLHVRLTPPQSPPRRGNSRIPPCTRVRRQPGGRARSAYPTEG